MTDPERIEALIESLDTVCDKMKAAGLAGLARYVGRIREAAAQLRADHPAQGEVSAVQHAPNCPLCHGAGEYQTIRGVMANCTCVHSTPSLAAQPEATPADAVLDSDQQRRIGATQEILGRPAVRAMLGLVPERPSLAAQAEAVERAAAGDKWKVFEFRGVWVPVADDDLGALSAAAETLVAAPAMVEALQRLASAEAFIVSRVATEEETARMEFARAALRALAGEREGK